MILTKLNKANKVLLEIIKITELDIQNIKVANHNFVLEHAEKKGELLKEFTKAKAELEQALIDLCAANTNKDMSELLSDEEQDGLKSLRLNLQSLKVKNKEYAKYALIVKDFFNQMLQAVMKEKGTNLAYGDMNISSEMVLKINA